MRFAVSLPVALFVAALNGPALAQDRYDLRDDWSDVANPNGTWTCREGTNALPFVAAWQRGDGSFTGEQRGWGRSETGNDRAPFWYRSLGLETLAVDTRTGDVTVHTNNDPGTTGNGNANVIWTAPRSGTVDVDGAVWMAADIGRGNDWFVYRNATLLTQGSIASGDPYDRAHPFRLAAGSGGPAALRGLAVTAGDEIRLEFVKTSQFGFLVGVDFGVVYVSTSAVAAKGDVAPDAAGATFETFGPPSIGADGRVAFRAAIAGGGAATTSDTGIWAESAGGLVLVAREGGAAPGTAGTFSTFSEPVSADGGIAFLSKLKGVPKTSATGIWSNASGALSLVAQQGSAAPGAGGATFKRFLTVGFLDGAGPVFAATLNGVPKTSGTGIWAADVSRNLRLVARAGDAVPLLSGQRTIKSLSLLAVPKKGAARSRRTDGDGGFAYLATFTDKSQAVFVVRRETVFVDGFDGSIGTAWSIMRQDASYYTAGAHTLDLRANGGDLYLGSNNAKNVFLADLDSDVDFTATLKLASFVPTADFTAAPQVDVLVYDDDDAMVRSNYGFFSVGSALSGVPGRKLEFGIETGASSFEKQQADRDFAGAPLWLRIVKTGAAYTPFVSADGVTFTPSADSRTFGDGSPSNVGFVAMVDHTETSHAQVDSFTLEVSRSRVLAASGFATDVALTTYAKLGVPAAGGDGRVAFAATLFPGTPVSKTDDAGVWSESDAGLKIAAREGDAAPGVNGGIFSAFGEPLPHEGGAVSFLATLKTGAGGVANTDATGIWSNAGGALDLVARQGSPAPGTTANYAAFLALAQADDGEVVFLATLSGAGVTPSNSIAIFAARGAGTTALLLRTGDALSVGGGQRTLARIDFLPAKLKVVGGGSRSVGRTGDLVLHAFFTDGSDAIVRITR